MRLREIRKAKGRQQKELAEKIGTDEPMMSKFENYKCPPIPSMMRKLLKELGCSRVEERGRKLWFTNILIYPRGRKSMPS